MSSIIGSGEFSIEDIDSFREVARSNFVPVVDCIYYLFSSFDLSIGTIFECPFKERKTEIPGDLLKTEKPFYDLLNQNIAIDGEDGVKNHYRICYRKFRGYIREVREFILEEIRQEFFPFLPSRACFFMFKHLDKRTFDFWYDELNRPPRLLKVQLNGTIFHTTEEHLLLDTFPLTVLHENAFKYWAGGPGKDTTRDEYIFLGKCKVLESRNARDVRRIT